MEMFLAFCGLGVFFALLIHGWPKFINIENNYYNNDDEEKSTEDDDS